jgi:predicted nucleic acid-binding protein
MIGLDTGFFIKLLEGNNAAIDVWNMLLDDKEDAIVSCITLFELERLSLKGKIEKKGGDILLDAIVSVCAISWLDNIQILLSGAKLSHAIGIHTTDSLILSGFVMSGVHTIYTTDSDMEFYKKKGIKVINLHKA